MAHSIAQRALHPIACVLQSVMHGFARISDREISRLIKIDLYFMFHFLARC
jgi:hypothetical protein